MTVAAAVNAPDHLRQMRIRAGELPDAPGVYTMYGQDEKAPLYVGKAGSLRKRVSSYFSGRAANNRLIKLAQKVERFRVTVTRNEAEALLLEDLLIKKYRPPYNIMLKDDKSYPWIRITGHDSPAVLYHRGAQKKSDRYFGPFASVPATRHTINELRRIFRLRNCTDSVFSNRSRPCLQYQIGRCSAPCVGLIGEQDYRADCAKAVRVLSGGSEQVLQELQEEMTQASTKLQYEQASKYRDRIVSLQRIRESQAVYVSGGRDCDLVAVAQEAGVVCIALMQIRGGEMSGSSHHFPQVPKSTEVAVSEAEVVRAFLSRWYLANPNWMPAQILVPSDLRGRQLLSAAFSSAAGRKVRVVGARQGQPAQWLQLAKVNAEAAVQTMLRDSSRFAGRMASLGEELGMDKLIGRMECHDISHHAGEKTYASCVVFGPMGPLRSGWRCYRMRPEIAGDDYLAMREMLHRRYSRMASEDWPDVLVLDGGKGQMSAAYEVLDGLGVSIERLVGIAKGPTRRAGRERLWVGRDSARLELMPVSPARLLLQHIRDEAHRFAVRYHRRSMGSGRRRSTLENIPGVGPAVRRTLMTHFGSIAQVSSADISALCRAPGIGPALAGAIHQYFRS